MINWEDEKRRLSYRYAVREFRRRYRQIDNNYQRYTNPSDWGVYPRRLIILFRLILILEEELKRITRAKRKKTRKDRGNA